MVKKISEIPELWEMVKDKEGYVNDVPISELTIGSNKKISWICNNGNWPDGVKKAEDHEWDQEIYARWDSDNQKVRECGFCSGKLAVESNSLWAFSNYEPDKYSFINQWYENNGKNAWQFEKKSGFDFFKLWKPIGHYTTKKVRPNQHDRKNTKFLWKCEEYEDHIWFSTVANRAKGSKCPFCYGDWVSLSTSILTTNPDISKQWHPHLNDHWKPCCFKPSSRKYKPTWKCEDGYERDRITVAQDHIWETLVPNRTKQNPTNCPFCSGAEVCVSTSMMTTHYELLEQWSKNNSKSFDEVSFGSNDKYLWICLKGHEEYLQSPKNKTIGGQGCPRCAITGFKIDEPAHFYIHKIINKETKDVIYYKAGISNNWERRIKQISYKLPKHMAIENLHLIYFEIGIHAKELETILLNKKEIRAPPRAFDGGHELFFTNPIKIALEELENLEINGT